MTLLFLLAATMLSQRIPGFVNDKDKTFPRQLFAFCVDGVASECVCREHLYLPGAACRGLVATQRAARSAGSLMYSRCT
jgi:hypothetical protein